MSADEKKLDKDIADLFSDINKLVLQKRSLKEFVIVEGRSIKNIQSDLDKVFNNIQSALVQYKADKGTDGEKKHIENLKKLNTLKKKYEQELDNAVGVLYKDAELKIED